VTVKNQMSSGSQRSDDDMPAEIDFSGGTRGQFFRPDARIVHPAIHLDLDVQAGLIGSAAARGAAVSGIADDLPRRPIASRGEAK
jgi:hypothetical protein